MHRKRLRVVLIAGLLIAAGAASLQAQESSTAGSAVSPEQEEQIKANGNSGFAMVRADIADEWDSATRLQVELPASFADVDAVQLPVLVPASVAPELQAAYLFAEANRYSVSIPVEDAHIVVEGSRLAIVHDNLAPGDTAAFRNDQGAIVSRTHGIVSASFNRLGVAYQIDVECRAPLEDVRCTEDGFVNSLIDELVVAGGVY